MLDLLGNIGNALSAVGSIFDLPSWFWCLLAGISCVFLGFALPLYWLVPLGVSLLLIGAFFGIRAAQP